MPGGPILSGPLIITPFVLCCARSDRIFPSGCCDVDGASLEERVSIMALVGIPAVGGAETPLGPFELDVYA